MKSFRRATGLIGLILLTAFFAPYVVKLPQMDITLILLGGLALAAYDFFSGGEDQ